MTLVGYVKARIEIVVLNAAQGHDKESDAFKTLQASTVKSIEKACSEVYGAIPTTQVAQLLATIAEAPFTDDQRAHLRTVFNNLLSEVCPLSTRQQQVEAPENFLTKRQWDGLLDKTETLQSNMIMLAGLWFKLGLKSPSEPTARNITAIAMLHEPDFVITSQQGVAHVRTFKKLLKDLVDRGIGFKKGPNVYRNPQQLKENHEAIYRHAFGDEEPCDCPSDTAGRLAEMKQKLGCRSSKKKTAASLAHRRCNTQAQAKIGGSF